MVLNLRYFNL